MPLQLRTQLRMCSSSSIQRSAGAAAPFNHPTMAPEAQQQPQPQRTFISVSTGMGPLPHENSVAGMDSSVSTFSFCGAMLWSCAGGRASVDGPIAAAYLLSRAWLNAGVAMGDQDGNRRWRTQTDDGQGEHVLTYHPKQIKGQEGTLLEGAHGRGVRGQSRVSGCGTRLTIAGDVLG
jgi:hypothetical protein